MEKTTPVKREFHPTESMGMSGLQTFDDAEFIDDNALAACLNVTIDSSQMSVRKGTNLLYAAPAGETGDPEQLFRFKDRNAVEYLLAKYTDNWYARSSVVDSWVIIASQTPGSPVATQATWHDAYYSNDLFIGANDANQGVFGDFAFFAPSDYSVPDNDLDPILTWPTGITTLASPANIGDTFIEVDDSNAINVTGGFTNGFGQIILNGQILNVYSKDGFQLIGSLTNGSPVMSGLGRTDIINLGAAISGFGVAPGTTVSQILSSSSILMSKNATADSTTSFTATGDVTSGSTFVGNLANEQGVITVGLGVSGTNIPASTNVTNVSAVGGPTASGQGTLASGSPVISSFITTAGLVTIGMSASGTDIPSGTTVVSTTSNTVVLSQNATGTITTPSNVSFASAVTGITISNPATGTSVQETLTFALATTYYYTFTEPNFLVLYNPITIPTAAGAIVANTLRQAPIPYGGNCVLSWLQQLIVATVSGSGSTVQTGVAFSQAGNPFSFSGVTAGIVGDKGQRIVDLVNFGQFFLAAGEDEMQVGQAIINAEASSYGIYFTPYLTGQGLGAVSGAGALNYNNEYYYPTTTNGIIALSPAFTGTSSSAGLSVLTDKIHNLFKKFTFLRGAAFDRKIWWRVSVDATPESPTLYYYLVYDLIRNGFTLIQHPSVDLVVYQETLCLFGTDGAIYEAEYDSYEDYIGGQSTSYLAEAYTKRWDYDQPSLPKNTQYVMVQGKLLTGTTLNIDVLYNEGGSLGRTHYKIVGDTSKPYFTLPKWDSMASDPLGTMVLGGGDPSAGYFRVYLELNQSLQAHTFQLRFWSKKAGSLWSIATVSPDVEVTNIPVENVISPS